MCPDPFLRNGSHLPEAVTLGSQGLPFLPVFVSETWLYSIVLKAWSGDWQRWNKGNSNIWGYGDQEAGLSSSFCFQLEPLNELVLPLTPLTTHVLQLFSDHLSSWPSLLSCTSFRASYCCSPPCPPASHACDFRPLCSLLALVSSSPYWPSPDGPSVLCGSHCCCLPSLSSLGWFLVLTLLVSTCVSMSPLPGVSSLSA